MVSPLKKNIKKKKLEVEDAADDWSQNCLEYFYNNKIFFPDIVSA